MFGHEINLIGFDLFRVMAELDFLIGKCLEIFYFLSAFLIAAKSIEKGSLTVSFLSMCLQSLGIKFMIYI